jgi:hypothetical protein
MTKIPKSLLDGMCIQVEPYIGNIDRDKLYALLTAMKTLAREHFSIPAQ